MVWPWAMWLVLLVFGTHGVQAAPEPGPPPSPSPSPSPATETATAPSEAKPPVAPDTETARTQPTPEPGEALRQRAARIRALIDGTLDPAIDPAPLFVLDLTDPAFVGPKGERLRALLARLDEPAPEPEPPAEPPRRRRGRPAPPPEPTPPPPVLDPADALAEAFEAFLRLTAEQREQAFATHARRQAAAVAEREASTRREARRASITRQADRLEAFLAGELALDVEPRSLLELDLSATHEAALDPDRRRAWPTVAPPSKPTDGATPTPAGTRTPAPDGTAPAPDGTAPTPSGTEPAPSGTEPAPAGEAAPTDAPPSEPAPQTATDAPAPPPDALARAETRLDALRQRFLALSPAQRTALFETHARRRDEAAKAKAEAEAARIREEEAKAAELAALELDQESAQRISEAEAEAEQASARLVRAQEEAKVARTEAARILKEEEARLLGITVDQANLEADLARRKTERIENHEDALEWQRRVDELASDQVFGTEREIEADAMYASIRSELGTTRDRLREALQGVRLAGTKVPGVGEGLDAVLPDDIDRGPVIAELREQVAAKQAELETLEPEVTWEVAQGLRDDVVLLNRTRLRLLEMASADLHDAVTGFGDRGVDQVRRELDQISVELGFHVLKVPRYKDLLVEQLRGSPISVLLAVVELMVVIAVYVWWRRRSAGLIARARRYFVQRRGDRRWTRQALAGLWYAERIRRPLELLLLLWFVLGSAGDLEAVPELELLWIIVRWILVGLTVILLLDAVAARQDRFSGVTNTTDTAELRIHSLRVVGINVIAIGMILSLTSAMVGEGAIYSWVISTCWLLSVPVVLYLVHRWRPTIAQRLAQRPEQTPFVAWAQRQETGWVRFVATMAAAGYLLGSGIGRWFMRQASGLEATRRVLAYLFRREVIKRAAEAAVAEVFERVDFACYGAFDPERHDAGPLTSVAETELDRVASLVDAPRSTLSAVVGERGMGKTTFLLALQQRLGRDRVEIISCPEEGLAGLMERIAALTGDPSARGPALVAALRERGPLILAIDDAHGLIQPAIRGLRELDRLTAFAREVGGEISWVLTMGAAAWHYLKRARGERVFFEQIVNLPRWTEEQLGALLQSRCEHVGIDPSFDGLVVPRQVDPMAAGSEEDRTESGYYRLLWDFSRGNPGVTLHAFRESLFVKPDASADGTPESGRTGQVVVRLFKEPTAKEIEELSLPLLFVLRAIVQLDIARHSELVAATQLPNADVSDALRFCQTRGYIERDAAHRHTQYRISWHWYRTVTTVLQRQHLLSPP